MLSLSMYIVCRVEIQLDANSSVEVMSNLMEETSDNDEVVSRHATMPSPLDTECFVNCDILGWLRTWYRHPEYIYGTGHKRSQNHKNIMVMNSSCMLKHEPGHSKLDLSGRVSKQ